MRNFAFLCFLSNKTSDYCFRLVIFTLSEVSSILKIDQNKKEKCLNPEALC